MKKQISCFRTTKIQNLRAIHNPIQIGELLQTVVSGRQRYKIWEQFTTLAYQRSLPSSCFRTTKIQNLRAIHNNLHRPNAPPRVVSGRQRYKIWEQFTTNLRTESLIPSLFQDDKDTKFESNSQLFVRLTACSMRCFRTTKIQNLRAIHNSGGTDDFVASGCFRTTKIQNLRAIHNQVRRKASLAEVVSGRQRYKIWEQFTTKKDYFTAAQPLFQDDKDTKFESNSQHHALQTPTAPRCFRTTKIQNLRAIHNVPALL